MYLFKNKYKFNIAAFREHASVFLRKLTGITRQVGISHLNALMSTGFVGA